MRSLLRISRLLVLLAAGLAAATTMSPPAQAQTSTPTVGIRLVDAPANRQNDPRAREYIVDHIAPGTTITRLVELSNSTAATQVVQLYPAAATVKDGKFQFGEGRAANDLTTWTAIGPSTLSLPGGAKAQAEVTIAVPANTTPGERYAVVWAELPGAAPFGGGITTVNRVGIRIYLSVGDGKEPTSDFVITAVQPRRDPHGNPTVAATVHNTGSRALDLSGDLQLAHGPGGLSAGPYPATLGTSLGVGQTEPVLVVLDQAIPAGPWNAHITLRSGTITREATATITFPVSAASTTTPIPTNTHPTGGNAVLLILVAIAGLISVSLVAAVFIRWRS